MDVILSNPQVWLGLALAISECLALIPAIKANSIFELVVGLLKKAKK